MDTVCSCVCILIARNGERAEARVGVISTNSLSCPSGPPWRFAASSAQEASVIRQVCPQVASTLAFSFQRWGRTQASAILDKCSVNELAVLKKKIFFPERLEV